MKRNPDIVIVGGGLAGLTAALDLIQRKFTVVLIEKKTFPHHKVCGEFISNEVLPYFIDLGVEIDTKSPTRISQTTISLSNGKSLSSSLPLGGFGISRYTLDNYLYQKAKDLGCIMLQDKVTNIQYLQNYFEVTTEKNGSFNAKIVLAAYGKRSNLDVSMKRNFIQRKSPWLGVKAHYKGTFPSDLVALHNFKGGYCGVSKVENDIINICYLTRYDVFKKFRKIEDFNEEVLHKNPELKSVLNSSSMIFEKHISISQISFENKKQLENHMLMLGDSAGLIHPLCGNGMAMAIHSAKIASEVVTDFLNGKTNRIEMEQLYQTRWNVHFKSRIQIGKWLSKVLLSSFLSSLMFYMLILFPGVLPKIIQKTHGKPIQ